MKKHISPVGYKYLLDNSTVSEEVCIPDAFNESRLQLITDAEAEEMMKEEEDKNS